LSLGDIVLVIDMPDSRGVNPKTRPAVVVGLPEETEAGDLIFVVAVTTRPDEVASDDRIGLPWSRPSHPRTGLNEPNAGVCSWLVRISVSANRPTDRDRPVPDPPHDHRSIERARSAGLSSNLPGG